MALKRFEDQVGAGQGGQETQRAFAEIRQGSGDLMYLIAEHRPERQETTGV
jgi:hypothetical protein